MGDNTFSIAIAYCGFVPIKHTRTNSCCCRFCLRWAISGRNDSITGTMLEVNYLPEVQRMLHRSAQAGDLKSEQNACSRSLRFVEIRNFWEIMQ
jgi:hypothetical protein